MRSPEPLPRELASSPFAVADARAGGIRKRRLYAVDLVRPFAGVRSADDRSDDLDWLCAAYLARAPEDRFFSHLTAARLHRLPLPVAVQVDHRLHVSVLAPARAVRGAGVAGHQLTAKPGLVTRVRGLPVANAVETWCQLAPSLGVDALVTAADALVAVGTIAPQRTLEAMTAALRVDSRRGVIALRSAFELVRPGTRSPAETRLRLLLLRAGIREPLVNQRVYARDGTFLGEGDLVFPEERLIIEYEGDYHRTDLRKFRDDIHRRERFEDERWSVLRLTADDLNGRSVETVERVRRRLRRSSRH